MSDLSATEFLKIKKEICPTHRHCIKCEFYYVCIAISNASDKEIQFDHLIKMVDEPLEDSLPETYSPDIAPSDIHLLQSS